MNPRPLRPERSALPSCATPRLKLRQPIAPAYRLTKSRLCASFPQARALELHQRLRGVGGIDGLDLIGGEVEEPAVTAVQVGRRIVGRSDGQVHLAVHVEEHGLDDGLPAGWTAVPPRAIVTITRADDPVIESL